MVVVDISTVSRGQVKQKFNLPTVCLLVVNLYRPGSSQIMLMFNTGPLHQYLILAHFHFVITPKQEYPELHQTSFWHGLCIFFIYYSTIFL